MLGAVIAMTVAVMTSTACIAVAISIYEGRPDRRTTLRLFTANLVVVLTNASLALVAVSVLWVSPGAGWLLIVMAMILFLGYRSYRACSASTTTSSCCTTSREQRLARCRSTRR